MKLAPHVTRIPADLIPIFGDVVRTDVSAPLPPRLEQRIGGSVIRQFYFAGVIEGRSRLVENAIRCRIDRAPLADIAVYLESEG